MTDSSAPTTSATRHWFSFPDPVNEVSARLVAAGVVVLCTTLLVTGWYWLTAVLAYGFLARVLTGPRLSPLGRAVTGIVTPRLSLDPRWTPGPPKRFAQGIGATLSTAAALVWFGLGAAVPTVVLVSMILIAASLEAAFGFCLGCRIFALLMRIGVVPESACEACNNLDLRRA
ncbi:MAG: DUF4395 domain-containing protein [Microthrixaceae bacterium]